MKTTFLSILRKILPVAAAVLSAAAANASDLQLAWSPSSYENTSEYRLYGEKTTLGKACDEEDLLFMGPALGAERTDAVVEGLTDGVYCFAVAPADETSEEAMSNILRLEIVGGVASFPANPPCDGVLSAPDVDEIAHILLGLATIDSRLFFDLDADGFINIRDLQRMNEVLGNGSCR